MTTERLTIPTADGRELDVLRHGPNDAFPLVFHCGTPNAPDEFPPLFDATTGKGWQLVAHARPGYALSTRQPGRTVADVANDTAAILDHLELDRFVTLGWSGGGPHALACAALLADRCVAAAIVAGVAPFDAEGLDFLAGMGPENVEEFGAAARDHDELQAFIDRFGAEMAEITGDAVAASLGGLVDHVDRAALTGEFADAMARMLRRAVSTGTAGWFDDDLAFVKPWGFDLAAIAVPVSIWQGAHDMMVPFAHGQWLAAHVPGADVHLYDDEGHVSLVNRLPEILDSLVSG
jgi:pimeloyl-ACP methyl ester carboxylesterase